MAMLPGSRDRRSWVILGRPMTHPEMIVSAFYTLVYAAAIYWLVPMLPREVAIFWPLSLGLLAVIWDLPRFRKSPEK